MPRSVTLLYFAAIREAAGISEEQLALPDAISTIRELPAFLEGCHPSLAGRLGSVRYAVNETFADPDTTIAASDVIALIPPVSGG